MIQAYNYMLENLPINRKDKYPVSKRSELKKVYADIVNLSKSSPFYMINLSKENQEFTIGVKEAALAVKAKIAEMSDPITSGFQSKSVAVSDERILKAQLMSEDVEELPSVIEFGVDTLADVQVNLGKELYLLSRGLPVGEYKFTARVNNETYPLTYVNSVRTDNQEVLSKMADLLNRSVPGISASIESGSANGYNRLRIAADMTGRYGDKRFLFEEEEDEYYTSIVDYFGMNRMDQASSFAEFSLNGVSKQTATNTFTLENKLRITLHNSSDKPATLRIVSDSQKILSNVDSFLESYNGLIQLANTRNLDNNERSKAYKLLGEIKILEQTYQEELTACGLIALEDGTLKMEDSLAVQSAEDGGMENLFTYKNGFIAKLLHKAETIAINPMEYLDKTVVTYPNSDKVPFRNPYVTSMYSGLFFSSYC